MKKLLFILLYIICLNLNSLTLKEIIDVNNGWSLFFINKKDIIITEKKGSIKLFDIKNQSIKEIKHNLKISSSGQGALMDIISYDGIIWVSYAENMPNGSTTSVATGMIKNDRITFKNIFRASPTIKSNYHYGGRLVLINGNIFLTVGDRGKGMIAQDFKKHPGSIIKIKKDGGFVIDNPKFQKNSGWLPEIFQIGVRNPQGLEYSFNDKKIYMTNHGAMGGDWFGVVKKGENYGWKILGWGGKNYIGTEIGPKWSSGFTKPIHYWVPSIGISSLIIYRGKEFKEWNGDALVTALKDQSLRRITFNNNQFIKEEVIFKDKIGRIRDIELSPINGKIYLLGENALWKLSK
ncbi:MAG: glucose dehydrogenase [Pelagibacterales bacterium]|nr:glucose dehydrogenase [Pelagibacterales bacterium]OUU62698.1 MAG: glucose dehydrogenase [Alphaproteobacteria bacterium TMED62]|tara:strand:- start:2088 stop:3134 length:1047 start_codon:yes stop_codon:yes gene_type:complete